MSSTATILAIDSMARMIMLRDSNGLEGVYTVGPEVQRFNELKIGDSAPATWRSHPSSWLQFAKFRVTRTPFRRRQAAGTRFPELRHRGLAFASFDRAAS